MLSKKLIAKFSLGTWNFFIPLKHWEVHIVLAESLAVQRSKVKTGIRVQSHPQKEGEVGAT